MAMGIVNDSEFEDELKRNGILPSSDSSENVKIIEKGRGIGKTAVPNNLRKIIGETSEIDGRQEALDLARHFDISPSSVSAYAHGNTSTASYNKPVESLVNNINQAKERITKRARNKLMMALNNITSEKMTESKARDLAGIAKDMSVIIRNMEPDTPVNLIGNGGPTFILYRPQVRKEESYDVMYSKE